MLRGFHSSSETWVFFSFFKGFLRAVSKFIKIFIVTVSTSLILTPPIAILLTFPTGFYCPVSLVLPLPPNVGPAPQPRVLGQPHSLASPFSGQHFISPTFSPVAPLKGSSEASSFLLYPPVSLTISFSTRPSSKPLCSLK